MPNTEELQSMAQEVREVMERLVKPMTSPLLTEGEMDQVPIGTGSFVSIRGSKYVLTAEHVVRDLSHRMGVLRGALYLPSENDFFTRSAPFTSAPFPVNLAFARIPTANSVMSLEQVDEMWSPVEGELLFALGYPGSAAGRTDAIIPSNERRVLFDSYPLTSVALIAQQNVSRVASRSRHNPDLHFTFQYGAFSLDGQPTPNPRGLSGTLVWDTKRIWAHRAGQPWQPEMARVCGMLHTEYVEDDFLSAVRIEHMRVALLQGIWQERAFLHWLDRGKPAEDTLTDWYWAIHTFPSLQG